MFQANLPPETWALILGVVGVFAAITLWAIRDAFSRTFPSTNEKIFWIQVSTMVPFLGGMAYLFMGRKRGTKQK
ncbi:PLD nuclease N-terminal domain-containing protein [Desulfohalovibrio reitneri]|uniref:PLD nuclease N-terminal domain-containing protein n=1 Tax=Desulfohalovibrio reitneri TaxID=1307759 RepID=UPI0004A6E71C|nr:PLD nuclease N-terminal domain-containing protein [Desulfohalovibrio reitneri]